MNRRGMPERLARLVSPEAIEAKVLHFAERAGSNAKKDMIVVGSAAVRSTLTELTARELTPDDIDLSVSEDLYRHLRTLPELREIHDSGARRLISADGVFDIGIGWRPTSHQDLARRSWESAEGISFASLPDIYAWKQNRNLQKDKLHTKLIRDYLQDPARNPFPAHIVRRELAIASKENIKHPLIDQARLLAANGLVRVFTMYGDPEIGRANQIIGDLEKAEFLVPATYHNGFDLEDDMAVFQQQLKLRGAPSIDRILALAIDPYSDAVYGHGRKRDRPRSHDELRSAKLLADQALKLGFSRQEAQRMYRAIMGTTFSEETRSQQGFNDPDPLIRETTAVDLHTLSSSRAVEGHLKITAEDIMSERFSKDRIPGRAIAEHGFRPTSTKDVFAFIDSHPNARPRSAPKGSPTLLQATANRLMSGADFSESYRPPKGWKLDNPQRRQQVASTIRNIVPQLIDDRGNQGKLRLTTLLRQAPNL